MTWFRSEKNTNWEGAFRVPCLVRWPGVIKPGTVTNELMSHNDWIPTLCAIAGEPDMISKLRSGYTANGTNYRVHLDGYDQSAFLRNVSGSAANNNGTKSARNKFFYSDDDGLLVAMRKGDYKYVYAEQRAPGQMQVWAEPFTKLRLQKIFNLMQDPFERADITSNTYWDWNLNQIGGIYGVMDEVFQFTATFKEFPPRSFPPSFVPATIMEETIDEAKAKARMPTTTGSGREASDDGRSSLKESRKRRTVGLYWILRAPIAWMPIATFLTASIRRTKLMAPVSMTNSRAGASSRVSGMSSSIGYPAPAIMSRNRVYSSSTATVSLNSVQVTSKSSC